MLGISLTLHAAVQAGAHAGTHAGSQPPFSALPADVQAKLRAVAAPPPLAEREAPYSTPMYYLMYAGYEYRGDEDRDPNGRCYPSMAGKTGPDFGNWKIDRNRPDWQEAMLRDFAEMGMTQTHVNIYPVRGELKLGKDLKQAIIDYARISASLGLKIGVRLDSLDETILWTMHPANPENRRAEYLSWVREVAALLKGKTVYYILGDELTLKSPSTTLPTKAWTAAMYLEYFKEVQAAIRSEDPSAKVSMFGSSSGEWFNVLDLLAHGYAEVGDGVAINHYNWRELSRFIADRDRLAPGKLLLTNGVGYISNGVVEPRYPEGDAYSKTPTEQAHAAEIARAMYAWWHGGAANAPYYISLRNWVVDGKTYPRWFGFFGFEDYVITNDKLTVKRYPGWYAYQAVATTFYNRSKCTTPAFPITTSAKIERLDAYERTSSRGSELLLMLWNDKDVPVRLNLGSSRFGYPVHVSLDNAGDWKDLVWGREGDSTWVELNVGTAPMIVRLFEQPK